MYFLILILVYFICFLFLVPRGLEVRACLRLASPGLRRAPGEDFFDMFIHLTKKRHGNSSSSSSSSSSARRAISRQYV